MDIEQMKKDYFWPHIDKYDFAAKVAPLLNEGQFYARPEDGKIVREEGQLDLNSPWVYVRPRPGSNCISWHGVMFQTFHIFPPECLKCWKVVVRPRTIIELIALLELQEKIDLYCKCGIEERDYVPALYGGYFYFDSKEAGLDGLEAVRKLIAEEISPDIPVFLKRYCTEFELAFGPSDVIEDNLPEDNAIWSRLVEQWFEVPINRYRQPAWLKQHVIRRWMMFAASRGDTSVFTFNGDQPFVPKSVTYEREDESCQ